MTKTALLLLFTADYFAFAYAHPTLCLIAGAVCSTAMIAEIVRPGCLTSKGTMIHCSHQGCSAEHKGDKWNNIKAQEAGWFSQRSGEHWCPDHTPSWVASWRESLS